MSARSSPASSRSARTSSRPTVSGQSVGLTRREFELLHVLAEARGQGDRARGDLPARWGYAMAHGDRSVDVFVRKRPQAGEAVRGGSTSTPTSGSATGSSRRGDGEGGEGEPTDEAWSRSRNPARRRRRVEAKRPPGGPSSAFTALLAQVHARDTRVRGSRPSLDRGRMELQESPGNRIGGRASILDTCPVCGRPVTEAHERSGMAREVRPFPMCLIRAAGPTAARAEGQLVEETVDA